MAQGFNQLVSALQRRYDYHSARAVALDALEVAGLEKRSSYEDKEWAKLLKATHATGDDLDHVWRALGAAPKGVKLIAAAEPATEPAPAKEEVAAEDPGAQASEPKKQATAKKGAAKKSSAKRKG